MKKIVSLACMLVVLVCASAQEIVIQQDLLEDAIANKKLIGTGSPDFANASTALRIDLSKASDAQFKNLQKKLMLVDTAVPDNIIKFEADGKSLVVNFKKAKLNSLNKGAVLILKWADDTKVALFRLVNGTGPVAHAANEADGVPSVSEYPKYFSEIENNIKINLVEKFKIPADFCCDTCKSCEDGILQHNNRIVYDALSGFTYYTGTDNCKSDEAPALIFCDTCAGWTTTKRRFRVSGNRPIRLRAGDPLVYIVRNVNPYLYDIELTDTAFLVNNESNGLLNDLLFAKAESATGIAPHAAGLEKETDEDRARYLRVKTGLIHLRAEMAELLENYRVMSRFAHNCIEQKKQEALVAINEFLQALGKNSRQSFTSFVDIHLHPTSIDSTLNKGLKALYGEFWRSKYVMAYRFPHVPEFDQINFTLSIKRKSDAPYPDLLKSNYPTQVGYIRNFFKVDVSSGLYYGGLNNKEFSTRKDSTAGVTPVVSGNRIVEENTGRNEFGFASYLHFYYKFGYFFNAGLHIGAGVNFSDKPRPRYFSGASFMLGNNNRVCINTGLMWGKVTELSDQYPREANGNYKWLPEEETTLVTRNKLKSGWFVSVTYNLPFLKRNKGAADVQPPAAKKDGD